MISELLISFMTLYIDLPNYKLSFFRRFIIGFIIAPHGITDIFHKSKVYQILYHLTLIIFSIIDYNLDLQYKICILTFLSIYHMSYDIGLLSSNLLHLITIFALNDKSGLGLDFFLTYMVLIHVPYHYYNSIKTITDIKYVILFSIFCFLLSLNEEIFIHLSKHFPINALIWTHIIFNIYI